MDRSPRENKNGQSPLASDDSDKCRSLVCDSSGIIIAEMVYRCMICYYVTDSIIEAKAHYQSDHMNDDDDEDQEMEPMPQSNQSALASNRSFNNINHNNNNHRNTFKNNNPLVPDISLYEESSPMNFKFNSNNNNHLSKHLLA